MVIGVLDEQHHGPFAQIRGPQFLDVLGTGELVGIRFDELREYGLGNLARQELLAVAGETVQQQAARHRLVTQIEQVDAPDEELEHLLRRIGRTPDLFEPLHVCEQFLQARNFRALAPLAPRKLAKLL